MSIVAMNTDTKERVDLTGKASGGSISWSVPAGLMEDHDLRLRAGWGPECRLPRPDQVAKYVSLVYQPYYDQFAKDFGQHHHRRVL